MRYLLILALFLPSCISMKKHNTLMMDYQISLHMDTVWFYDKGKFVGRFIHTSDSSWNNGYDSIIIKDNL
jgi:hypothetical protein